MTKLLGFCYISPSFILEINVVLMAVGFIFLVDLYNHICVNRSTLIRVNMAVYELGLDARMNWIRGFSLLGYELNGILGIRIAKNPTIFKFASYMLAGSIILIFLFSIGLSRFHCGIEYKYYTNMILTDMWRLKNIETVEARFDCCGKNGAIDYIMDNRTWSKASCCDLADCLGCAEMFHDFLHNIEMEITRDNILLLICLAIGLILMILYYKDVVLEDDPYLSESSEDEDEDELVSRHTNTANSFTSPL